MLEYTFKFMRLSHLAPTFVDDKKPKMNCFEVGLNSNIKERIFMRQYIFYMDLYDTTVNVERAMKERNNYFNE